MPAVDCVVETEVSNSVRARQVEALFDVPRQERARLSWKGDVPIEGEPWSIGLITGPSGSGKSQVARSMFPSYHPNLEWSAPSVIDDVSQDVSVEKITQAFGAVGFNTIPAWLRPYAVLSNGERFRADLARRLIELPDPVVVDEFSSVVDRQVAKIGAHAVQKWARRNGRQFVAVSCHEDIVDWLQPDWVLRPADMSFARRSVRYRPSVECEIRRVEYALWKLFAPYHYLTASLHRAARCHALFVDDAPVSFVATLHLAHPRVMNMKRVSRLVTLPDWQGLGLAFALRDSVASAYAALACRVRTYPAHPSLIRSLCRSENWIMTKRPGQFKYRTGKTSSRRSAQKNRPCAIFEWVGRPMNDLEQATKLLEGSSCTH